MADHRTASLPTAPHDLRKRGMLASRWEGSVFNLWFLVLSGNFLTGFALFLGADGFTLGVLGALIPLSTLLQLFTAPLVAGVQRRRNALFLLAFLQRVVGSLAGFIALWLMPSPWALTIFVLLNIGIWTAQAPLSIVWQGYMTDLVPLEGRGRYFAGRSAWSQSVAVVATLVYGFMLDHWPGAPGFRYLWLAALLGGVVDVAALFLHPEVPRGDKPTVRPFWEGIRAPLARKGPHRTMALYMAVLAFAAGLAVPFYPMQLVQRLGLSFGAASILSTIAAGSAILTASYWGRLADRLGETKTIGILVGLLATVPVLLLLGKHGGWPVLILAHLLFGTANNAVLLANQTLTMRLAPDEDRGSYFAFFAAAGGLTGVLAPILVGPLTTQYMGPLFIASAVSYGALALFWHLRLGPRVARESHS